MQLQNLKQPLIRCQDDYAYAQLTIVIPVRIDSEERSANLKTIIYHVSQLGSRIIVLEADEVPKLKDERWPNGVDYIFVEDSNPVFHRTAYINILLNKAHTDIIAIWDTDILIDLESINKSIDLINNGQTIVYPYNGKFVMLSEEYSSLLRHKFDIKHLESVKMKPVFNRPFCGGIYIVHKYRYLECGGENENFSGWGPEDAERLRRVRILGHKVAWVKSGRAYHLWHPRGKNSTFFTEADEVRLKMEMVKVSSMNKTELQNYITNKKWNITKI